MPLSCSSFLQWENHNKSLQLEAQTYQRIQEKIQERVMNNLGTWIDWQYLQNAAKLLAKVDTFLASWSSTLVHVPRWREGVKAADPGLWCGLLHRISWGLEWQPSAWHKVQTVSNGCASERNEFFISVRGLDYRFEDGLLVAYQPLCVAIERQGDEAGFVVTFVFTTACWIF